ncbi:hypothetical protein EJB05_49570, partial [Eragrostis curvula]
RRGFLRAVRSGRVALRRCPLDAIPLFRFIRRVASCGEPVPGYANEAWEVALPAEEVPTELPEPALGINFACDGMNRRDWLTLVAVHSDSSLLAVAFTMPPGSTVTTVYCTYFSDRLLFRCLESSSIAQNRWPTFPLHDTPHHLQEGNLDEGMQWSHDFPRQFDL